MDSASAARSEALTIRWGSSAKISWAPRETLPLPVKAKTNGLNSRGRPPRAMSTPMASIATLAAASVRYVCDMPTFCGRGHGHIRARARAGPLARGRWPGGSARAGRTRKGEL